MNNLCPSLNPPHPPTQTFFKCTPSCFVQLKICISHRTGYLTSKTVLHLMHSILHIIMQSHKMLCRYSYMICQYLSQNNLLTITGFTNLSSGGWCTTPHSTCSFRRYILWHGSFALVFYLSFSAFVSPPLLPFLPSGQIILVFVYAPSLSNCWM